MDHLVSKGVMVRSSSIEWGLDPQWSASLAASQDRTVLTLAKPQAMHTKRVSKRQLDSPYHTVTLLPRAFGAENDPVGCFRYRRWRSPTRSDCEDWANL